MRWLAVLAVLTLGAITAVSGLPASVFTLSRHFPPEHGYNPIDDIKSWPDARYLREHGTKFVWSQSRAESVDIRRLVDMDIADEPDRKKRLEAIYIIDFAAIIFFLIILTVNFIRRRGSQIKETAINAAADGVRAGRQIKSTAQAIGTKIKQRADDRAK